MDTDDNGIDMSDLDIAEAFLLSGILDKFCNALGAKAGTAEYVRRAVTNLRAENARLAAELADADDEIRRLNNELAKALNLPF